MKKCANDNWGLTTLSDEITVQEIITLLSLLDRMQGSVLW